MKKQKAPHNAARIRNRYVGKTALEYEANRVNSGKWRAEHAAIGVFLAQLPPRIVVADIPVGTGRYAEHYAARGILVHGLDTSKDMMGLAAKQFAKHGVERYFNLHDALKPLEARYDAIVCTRLLNHFTLEEAQQTVGNFLSAAPVVIIGLRQPKNPPVERNWHLLSDVLAPFNVSHEEIVLEESDASVYVMSKLTYVG